MRFCGCVATAAAVAVFSTTVVPAASAAPRCFPESFMFGSATAAYQVEGAVKEGGRSPSIWDDWCRSQPDVLCANVADDFYHRYKDDIKLMVETGLQSFRFSISWSRVMNWDNSTKRMKVNSEGVQFYHSLIDELRTNHIEPVLTLYHWDLPSELESQLSPPGWLNSEIQDHFVEFSELAFTEFGDKVDLWTTFNEPTSFVGNGYASGGSPPGYSGSDTQAYVASTNVLVAHAKSVARFRELQKAGVVGGNARIGIVLHSRYYYPLDPANLNDVEAAERGMQSDMGWFLEPILSGDYPAVMRERAGGRLPQFTADEASLLKGSYDLFMLNHYGSNAVTDCDSPTSKTSCESLLPGWMKDKGLDISHTMPGSLQSKYENCATFAGYPIGYLEFIKWVHAKDPAADILLTENGWCGNEDIDNSDQLEYFQKFVEQVYIAIHDEKIPVIGYTAWSLLDNNEWGTYDARFGLYYVDFPKEAGARDFYAPNVTDLARIPRPSATWFQQVATTRCLDDVAVATGDRIPPLGPGKMTLLKMGVIGVSAVGVGVAVLTATRRRGYTSVPA